MGRSRGREKLDRVVDHFAALFEHIPGLQANFIFGSDLDSGDEPVELTREFVRRTPFVWPTVNIPMPFGGTPLYDSLLEQGRVLRTMPFAFYYNPHLVSTILNYDPISYYEKLLQIFAEMTSSHMLARRLALRLPWVLRAYFVLRTAAMRVYVREYQRLLTLMKRDRSFAAFHRGATDELPEYYHHRLDYKLGSFASLLTHADRTPEFSQPQSSADYLSA